jgi:hypothetical protein
MTNTAVPAPTSGIWRRLWNFLQAAEVSSAEYQDLCIDALERRVAELQKELQERASSAPSEALGTPIQKKCEAHGTPRCT